MDDKPFIVPVGAARALSHSRRATMIDFEPDDAPWPDLGVNIQIMQPGQPNCRYHSEPVQEDFLVLHGECIVILDGEERPCSSGTSCTARREPSTSSWGPATVPAPC